MQTLELNNYLVPYDFSQSTKDAFYYAKMLVEENGGNIMLMHLVNEESEIPAASKSLDKMITSLSEKFTGKVSYKVMVGDIDKHINQIAESTSTDIVILGKHENNFLHRIFGSRAAKVAASSSVPFIITQVVKEDEDGLNKILLPFNHERESLQVVQLAASVAKAHNATIHLAGYHDSDESLYQEMRVNQGIISKFLEEEGIDYLSVPITGKESYDDLLMSYARSNQFDLIAAAYLDYGVSSFFNSFIDQLLNKQKDIPVLTVNGPEVMNHKPKLAYVPV